MTSGSAIYDTAVLEFDFERLKVYQKTLGLMDDVFKVFRKIPPEFRYLVGNNLVRAALSVANNIAEGSDKKSKKERARYYQTSSDSARECVSVFIVLRRQEVMSETLCRQLRQTVREITSVLRGLIRAL